MGDRSSASLWLLVAGCAWAGTTGGLPVETGPARPAQRPPTCPPQPTTPTSHGPTAGRADCARAPPASRAPTTRAVRGVATGVALVAHTLPVQCAQPPSHHPGRERDSSPLLKHPQAPRQGEPCPGRCWRATQREPSAHSQKPEAKRLTHQLLLCSPARLARRAVKRVLSLLTTSEEPSAQGGPVKQVIWRG